MQTYTQNHAKLETNFGTTLSGTNSEHSSGTDIELVPIWYQADAELVPKDTNYLQLLVHTSYQYLVWMCLLVLMPASYQNCDTVEQP